MPTAVIYGYNLPALLSQIVDLLVDPASGYLNCYAQKWKLNMKPKRIQSLKGFLCKSLENKFFFRTYNEDGTYIDYEICHSDLEIQILDPDA